MNHRITKQFELKGASFDERGQLNGIANVMGIVDRGDEVVFPGFFEPALPGFRANGFIAVGHKWNELPIAMPTLAEERGNQLYSETIFHSTQAAQDARTVARERIERGLTLGLSVGFSLSETGCRQFKNGKALLACAVELGCDMSLFDAPGIEAVNRPLLGLLPGGCDELFEWSIAPVPMNQPSTVTEVKSMTAKKDASEETVVPKEIPATAPNVITKSQFLGVAPRSVTCSALNTDSSALMRTVLQSLYSADTASTEGLVTALAPAFDEFRDLSLATLTALLANADWDELAEDAREWYWYYSLPAEDRGNLKFTEKAAALETETAVFLSAATRRQEVRQKSGRTLSQATRDRMQAIADGLAGACEKLKTLLDENPAEDAEADVKTDEAELETKTAGPSRAFRDRLLLETKLRNALSQANAPAEGDHS